MLGKKWNHRRFVTENLWSKCEGWQGVEKKEISVWKNSHILIYVDKLKKLIDLHVNHKFRGGLLGVILIVTTASMKITTAEECTSSGNSLPLLVHIITTAVRITVGSNTPWYVFEWYFEFYHQVCGIYLVILRSLFLCRTVVYEWEQWMKQTVSSNIIKNNNTSDLSITRFTTWSSKNVWELYLTLSLGPPFIAQGVLFYKIRIMIIE